MRFYSTTNKNETASLAEAIFQGLAPDGGLYLPEQIPVLPASFFASLHERTLQEIAEGVLRPYLAELSKETLRGIVNDVFTFPIPLVKLSEQLSVLELFHGPTLAFKDVGARWLARLMAALRPTEGPPITILVATSGDTGSAVASGFFGLPGIQVVILYPSGKVSPLQEAQLTTMGGNVTALEVDGTFDDCQRLVKSAFTDQTLRQQTSLSSANSINIGRLLPQMVYYFWAMAQLPAITTVCVPSGNFGNLTAGLLAKRMGLPVKRFVAATNVNDVIPQFLQDGLFTPRPSVATLASAMDVGNPSNAARMFALYQNDLSTMRSEITGHKVTDQQIRATIKDVYQRRNYLLDPHTAVGICAVVALKQNEPTVVLATAHPAKFKETVEAATGKTIPLPQVLADALAKPKMVIRLSKDFSDLKTFLLDARR